MQEAKRKGRPPIENKEAVQDTHMNLPVSVVTAIDAVKHPDESRTEYILRSILEREEIQSASETTTKYQFHRINRGVTLPEELFELYKFCGVMLKASASLLMEEALIAYIPLLKKRLQARSANVAIAFTEMLQQYGIGSDEE
jgi:hypothetical protein